MEAQKPEIEGHALLDRYLAAAMEYGVLLREWEECPNPNKKTFTALADLANLRADDAHFLWMEWRRKNPEQRTVAAGR